MSETPEETPEETSYQAALRQAARCRIGFCAHTDAEHARLDAEIAELRRAQRPQHPV